MTREELLKVAKPILFNTEMVQAILEGRKTVTRRAIKLDLGLADMDKTDNSYLKIPDEYGDYHDAKDLCRHRVGDILYVRETFRYVSIGEVTYEGECIWQEDVIQFKASEEEFDEEYELFIGEYEKWKPSIHMPKDIARIFLKVIDVRVERLQDITVSDILREGIREIKGLKHVFHKITEHKNEFKTLWNSTVKEQELSRYGWESNPFVWVIEFERVIPK
ncbi:MAG TPA: hypothetical protein GX707_15760 [Epulopiscium sp.]|nr:hypothetical protein [Candidatus Epulonipiscium sp.]